ncbi:interleukin-20 receptor subunit beta [Gracilinanus agilis]|uniref:interleukin-20 receptor subunit beta n=1 Tax=Gracilinanus agilis TaxID=191870 RepID=UPI001CFCEFD5|nr:interleukin-20 receptor subunit beta [Gracilinanus agilis]
MVLKEASANLLVALFYTLIATLLTDAAVILPAPLDLSVHSINMNHILTWSPVIVPGKIVNYSVEYQGEYERYYTSSTWIPSSWCSSISTPECNVTDDITATVAYNFRVRATLGNQSSSWSTLKELFNRNSTILTSPRMKISKDGYHLIVEFEDMGPYFEFNVTYWKKSPNSQVLYKIVREGGSLVHLETMEAGVEYCVKAQTIVEVIERSSAFNQVECVRAQDESPLLVLVLCTSVAFILFLVGVPLLVWKMSQLLRYSCCPVVVLPDTLKITDSPQKLISCKREDVEPCDTVVRVVYPEELFRSWIQEAL